MPITAGSISIGRRINTGDYSHKEAKVELHYVAEGGEKIGDLGDTARVEALTQLSAILSTVVTIEHTPEIVVDGGVAATIEPKKSPLAGLELPKRHRRTKAEMEAARATQDPAGVDYAAVQEAHTGADPTPGDVPTAPVEPASEPAPAATEISDKELNNACNETMNRIKNKVVIQETIARFTNGGVSTIPQEHRAHFLGLLKTL